MCFCNQPLVYVDQKDALQEAQMEGGRMIKSVNYTTVSGA